MILRDTGNWTFGLLRNAALSAGALLACASAQAQDSVAAFYGGRTISINIGFPPGGKVGAELDPKSGLETQAISDAILATSPDVIKGAIEISK